MSDPKENFFDDTAKVMLGVLLLIVILGLWGFVGYDRIGAGSEAEQHGQSGSWFRPISAVLTSIAATVAAAAVWLHVKESCESRKEQAQSTEALSTIAQVNGLTALTELLQSQRREVLNRLALCESVAVKISTSAGDRVGKKSWRDCLDDLDTESRSTVQRILETQGVEHDSECQQASTDRLMAGLAAEADFWTQKAAEIVDGLLDTGSQLARLTQSSVDPELFKPDDLRALGDQIKARTSPKPDKPEEPLPSRLKKTPESSLPSAPKTTARNHSKTTPKKAAKKSLTKTAKKTGKKTPKKTPKTSAKKAAKKVTKKAAKKANKKTAKKAAKKVPRKAPKRGLGKGFKEIK